MCVGGGGGGGGSLGYQDPCQKWYESLGLRLGGGGGGGGVGGNFGVCSLSASTILSRSVHQIMSSVFRARPPFSAARPECSAQLKGPCGSGTGERPVFPVPDKGWI